MENKLKLSFHGGVGSVTGANFLIADEQTKILVDCGIMQGSKFAEERNKEDFPYNPSDIDVLLVTHAHADHIGRIPKLVKDGFRGRIISTKETEKIVEPMFEDSLSIMRVENPGVPENELLFTKNDVGKALSLWESTSYGESVRLSEGFTAIFRDAGHILGSATIEVVHSNGTRTLFTGDLGSPPSPLAQNTEYVKGVHYMVTESVYGDRVHEGKELRQEKLTRIIKGAVERKGALIIPAFSLERTQVILHEINDLIRDGEIPSLPVFLDSPLAITMTEIYRESADLFNEHAKEEIAGGDDIFHFPSLELTRQVRDSKEIFNAPDPKIIIAGSGMSAGGRVIHHEKRFLGDPRATILFVGYQSPGSLGRLIQDGAKNVKIFDKEIKVRANIETVSGYSAHADRDDLLDFVEASRDSLKRVFVAMGEPKSSLFLAQRINDFLDVEAVVPEEGDSFLLE